MDHYARPVERTLAWLGRYRRLRVRYEKRKDIHEAFLQIGCALITRNAVQRYC
jgi:transposase